MHLYWHQICRCIGRIHDAIVRGHGHFDNPSRSLSRPVVDQSLPNTGGQRIVIVCCPSFPWHKGARRETVAIDPRGGFPEDELFVCSFSAATWQRGPHFSGWPRPAIALSSASPFVPPSFSCLSYSLSFSKRQKKKTHLHNAQLRFPGKLRLCT